LPTGSAISFRSSGRDCLNSKGVKVNTVLRLTLRLLGPITRLLVNLQVEIICRLSAEER
jgi:hypothetical protein